MLNDAPATNDDEQPDSVNHSHGGFSGGEGIGPPDYNPIRDRLQRIEHDKHDKKQPAGIKALCVLGRPKMCMRQKIFRIQLCARNSGEKMAGVPGAALRPPRTRAKPRSRHSGGCSID